jgi:hypothetical protein
MPCGQAARQKDIPKGRKKKKGNSLWGDIKEPQQFFLLQEKVDNISDPIFLAALFSLSRLSLGFFSELEPVGSHSTDNTRVISFFSFF